MDVPASAGWMSSGYGNLGPNRPGLMLTLAPQTESPRISPRTPGECRVPQIATAGLRWRSFSARSRNSFASRAVLTVMALNTGS